MAGMDNLKNVVREPHVVELKPWKSIHYEIKEPMVTGLGIVDIPESVLESGFARITEPVSMGNPTHKHPFDQWIYLIGESSNFAEIDADIELTLGDRIVKINYPCYVFIPKGVMHCPLDVKRVGKPFIFIDSRITEEASVRPASVKKHAPMKYIAKKRQ
ncbi:MAG: hypothetical protein A2147_10225 [Chloroflexi bacterium RBG_16_57_8]|nr:MAG: hypothetical protein A2147_10225 [Chloroflexi bacterium RBG_16_57_8]